MFLDLGAKYFVCMFDQVEKMLWSKVCSFSSVMLDCIGIATQATPTITHHNRDRVQGNGSKALSGGLIPAMYRVHDILIKVSIAWGIMCHSLRIGQYQS